METIETTLQRPTPRNWAATVVDLEQALDRARTERDALEKRRQELLLPAMDNQEAKAEMETVTTALANARTQIADLEDTLSQARVAATRQREATKAEAIQAMEVMLSELEAQRSTLITQARKSEDPAALEQAYVCHRQCYGLKHTLYTLTHEPRFHEFWGFGVFGQRLEAEVTFLHRIRKSTDFVIPQPWADLEQIASAQ